MTALSLRLPGATPCDLLHAVALATGMPMAYLRWPGGHCLWATAAYAQILAMPTQELQGKAPQNYLTPCDWDDWQCALARVADAQTPGASVHTVLPFGPRRMATQLIAHLEGAQVQGMVVAPLQDLVGADVLQLVQDSDTRLRRYAEATSEALIFFRQGRICDANPAAVALTGYPWRQLLDRPVLHLLPPALRTPASVLLEQGTPQAHATRLLHHDGQELDVEISVHFLPQDGEALGLLVLRDIRERKRAETDRYFLANHDPLTQLPNRQGLLRHLRETLLQAAQRSLPVALLHVDLNRFKDVNDSLGHEAGDQVLLETARRLRSKVHPDDLVARLGADEFVVLLRTPLTARQPDCLLREIRFVLNKPYALPQGLVHLGAAMGVSLYPEDGTNAETLLLNASAAMRTAKHQGHDYQYYSAIMDKRPSRLLAQERLLREAVEQDQGLLLHFQPQWNFSTNRLEGFEALVRWQHPERGLLPPAEFISFAESRGLISLVDRWVMRAACRQWQAWHKAGLPPAVVSVNMSAIEFNQSHLAAEVQQILRDTGVPAQWLEIELTETTLMQHSEHVLDTLEDLQKLGVRLSIDDFGTGYSSLAYLKRYPLDKIKIDRSFVKDTPADADDVSIITAIIQMAHSLNLRAVAEGVETQDQWNLLAAMGCDLVQGYHLSRPLSAQDALHWQQQGCQTRGPQ